MPEARGRGPLRSEVRRLRVFGLEQVRHHQAGQEWVPHWHDEWSFGAVVRGECRCSVAGHPFVARAGDLIAIAPGVVHTGALLATAPGDGVTVMMFYVPGAWVQAAGLQAPVRSAKRASPALARAAAALQSADEVQAWLRRAVPVLAAAARHAGAAQADPRPGEAVRALIGRLQAALQAGEHTVAGLARHCGVSRERLHRVLRRWLGMPPAAYVRAVRVHRARQLLLEGAPVAAVAADCGFADQAHFTRWFRRTFGYSPGDLVLAGAARSVTAERSARQRRQG